jgi:predicted GTPase
MKLSHVIWVQQQTEQYGPVAQKGWRVGFGLWRLARAILNPLQAAGQETSGLIVEKTASVLSYRLRAYATRLLVLEVGRAAIDLYSGRLALSDDEIRAAQDRDLAAAESPTPMPVRILLVGQVSAGKSSLVNAMSLAVRAAVGPLPTTAHVSEHRLELEGRPAVTLVDMAGLDEHLPKPEELLKEAARADLILWVASATQPARAPDRSGLDTVRTWAKAQLARRPPSILLALTHVDQLRPAAEWAPPYDITTPARAKARAIRAAMDAAGPALDIPADAIVPVAVPPGREPYNIDALWARMAMEIDEAKLVQLDRLRIGRDQLGLRELAAQLGNAGRVVIRGLAGA